MRAFEERSKNLLTEINSRRKRKEFYWDRQTFTRIVRKDHKNTTPKITVELNDHLENPVSSKTLKRGAAQSWISRKDCNQKTLLE